MTALQSDTKVIIGKWADKKEVLFLTTVAPPEMVEVRNRRGVVMKKPTTVLQYNTMKSFIDVSDQKGSYASAVRKSIKWYRKLAFEILLNMTVVNAHNLYKKVPITDKFMTITKFKEEIAKSLINLGLRNKQTDPTNQNMKHELLQMKKRGRCHFCYRYLSCSFGRNHAVKNCKRVNTMCSKCDNKFMCLPCFFNNHTSTSNTLKT